MFLFAAVSQCVDRRDLVVRHVGDMHNAAVQRFELEIDLRRAVEEEQFVLFYQPIIRLETAEIIGAEALIRWNHPERGLIPPAEFIPAAERSGLILPIGTWVIRAACTQTARFQALSPDQWHTSVNLSGRQLADPDIVSIVAAAIADADLMPSQLTLEITESVLMHDTATTIDRLFALRNLGVHLAIDDFGTGYSSLSYLRSFPVDELKIDKSFIDAIASNEEDAALVEAITRLGSTLHLEVVAEGIEHAVQARILEAAGCRQGQGYHFSRPLTAEALELAYWPAGKALSTH